MGYVGHNCLVPGPCGLSGSPCLPGASPLVSETSPKYIDREGLGKRRKSIKISFPYYDWRQWLKSIVGDHTNEGEIKQ